MAGPTSATCAFRNLIAGGASLAGCSATQPSGCASATFRLLDYSTSEEPDYIAFLEHCGFGELTRTTRGWTRDTTHVRS
jgi:hypothetical protein